MVHVHENHFAPYAIRSENAGGRIHSEETESILSPFELDRYRIIASTAFRRLNGKTQVFAPDYHDHFRSRLTHTLEAAQLARVLALRLNANEVLAETITLAHDLGHTPFGHAGEAALDGCMVDHGGFNHNTHSLRVVDYLEHPFPSFRGLNITQDTRAGLMTHATPHDIPAVKETKNQLQPKDFSAGSSVESQIASIADRIAYNLHDLEDAIGAEMLHLDCLHDLSIWRDAYHHTVREFKDKKIHAIRRVVLDAILNHVLIDILETSQTRLTNINTVQEAKKSDLNLVATSQEVENQLLELELFLTKKVYCNPEVVKMDTQGQKMIVTLFDTYRKNPEKMQSRFTDRIDELGPDRVICDYIAGMTDRFCRDEYNKLSRML